MNILASWVTRRAWVVVALWAVVWLALLPFGITVQKVLKGGGFDAPWKEYNRVKEDMDRIFGGARSSLLLEFKRPIGVDGTFDDRVEQAVAPLRRHGDVAYVRTKASTFDSRYLSSDGQGTLVIVGTHLDDFHLQQKIEEIQGLLKADGLEWKITGAAPFNVALTDITRQDALRGEMVAVPIVFIMLLLLFRSLPAALLPVGIAGVSIPLTLSLVHLVGLRFDLSLFLLNIASLLGIGLAIDYALLIVSRYREERLRTPDPQVAMARTLDTAGRAVLFSALTVMVGLSGMAFFGYMFMTSLALGGALVVAVSLLASLTLLPAVLHLLGPALERGRLPWKVGAAGGGLFSRLCGWALRFPVMTLILMGVGLGVAGLPMLQTRLGTSHTEVLPKDSPPRAHLERVLTQYDLMPRVGDLLLVVKPLSGSMDDLSQIRGLHRLAQELYLVDGVKSVDSPVTLGGFRDLKTTVAMFESRKKNRGLDNPLWDRALETVLRPGAALFRVRTDWKPGDADGEALVRALRKGGPPDMEIGVTGEIPRLMDFSEDLYERFPWATVWVLAMTLVLLLIMFRSLLLPIKAVAATLLSMVATLGAIVFIFQLGHFEKVLGFSSSGFTEAVLPAVLFSVLFGLAMDYEVFLLARIKEVWDETGDNDRAVATGVERTTGLITGAAMAMVVVASGFALAEILPVKIIGVGIAIAVFIDATLVRALLVPAVMKLMGRWNWYLPSFMEKILPRVRPH